MGVLEVTMHRFRSARRRAAVERNLQELADLKNQLYRAQVELYEWWCWWESWSHATEASNEPLHGSTGREAAGGSDRLLAGGGKRALHREGDLPEEAAIVTKAVHGPIEVPQVHCINLVDDVPVVKQQQVPSVQKVQRTVEVPQVKTIAQTSADKASNSFKLGVKRACRDFEEREKPFWLELEDYDDEDFEDDSSYEDTDSETGGGAGAVPTPLSLLKSDSAPNVRSGSISKSLGPIFGTSTFSTSSVPSASGSLGGSSGSIFGAVGSPGSGSIFGSTGSIIGVNPSGGSGLIFGASCDARSSTGGSSVNSSAPVFVFGEPGDGAAEGLLPEGNNPRTLQHEGVPHLAGHGERAQQRDAGVTPHARVVRFVSTLCSIVEEQEEVQEDYEDHEAWLDYALQQEHRSRCML